MFDFITDWDRDWAPGPIPRTPEERAAAAKKYGLRPEDYISREGDDSLQAAPEMGDYPQMPVVGYYYRDPYEVYDFPEQKRNHGEFVRNSF